MFVLVSVAMPEKKPKKSAPRGVYERRPGVWYVRYADASGRIRREKAGSKSEARDLYTKRKAEVLRGQKLPELSRRRCMTLADAIEHYQDELRAKRSYRDDRRYSKVWTAALGQLALDQVSARDVERWKAVKRQQAKPATVNRHVQFLKRIFSLAVRDGLVERHPLAGVRKLRENNARVRYLEADEEARLRAVLAPHRWLMVELAILTGLRQGEQFGRGGLRRENVDFGAGVITIPRSKHGEARHVPMSPRARAILEQQLTSHGEAWVFPGRTSGRPYAGTSASHFLGRALVRAGIRGFTWHCLRHTFCSRLVMRGVSLRAVQALAGHKTITVTERYAHLAPDHLRQAVALVDR